MHILLWIPFEDASESHLDISQKIHSCDLILLHHSTKVVSILPQAYSVIQLMEVFNYNKDSGTVTDFEYIILEVMDKLVCNMVVDSLFMHNL